MLIPMFVTIIVCLVVVLAILKNLKYLKLSKQLRCNIKSWPLLGHAYIFIGNDEAVSREPNCNFQFLCYQSLTLSQQSYYWTTITDRMNSLMKVGLDAMANGGVSKVWLGPYLFVVISDAIDVKAILKTNLEKGKHLLKLGRFLIGNGSIFAPVHRWRPRRRILVSTFNSKNMKQFIKVFSNQSHILVRMLEKNVNKGSFSIWSYLAKYFMDSTLETIFGVNSNIQQPFNKLFIEAFEKIFELASSIVFMPWLFNETILKIVRPSMCKLYKTSINILNVFLDEIIKQKRENLKKHIEDKKPTEKNNNSNRNDNIENKKIKAFLEIMLQISESQEGFNDLDIRNELMTIAIAGTDTSSVGTSTVISMLAKHHEVQAEVCKELQDIFGDSDRPVTWEDLPKMKYLEAVIKESLRLYPPVPIILREVTENFNLSSGVTLVPGTNVVINIWAVHHNPKYWGDDVESFRPERFLDDHKLSSAAFVAFSFGPRNCIGYQFAMMSMKIVLANIIRDYRVLPVGDQESPMRFQYRIIMKDVNNYLIGLEKRNKVNNNR